MSVPAWSYIESVDRINHWRSIDEEGVAPDGQLIFLSHGEQTQKAIIFFHGHTNCPRQFEAMGKIFYNRGFNVLIPRVPHHGLRDRMTEDHASLTVWELINTSEAAVDIARGLGRHITVVGFSMGANMAGWVAQNRSDVDQVVIIAPFWGWKGLPAQLFRPLMILMSVLPNMFVWWDRETKKALMGPTSSYYRFSTRGVAQIMRLGWSVMEAAKVHAPKAHSIVVITSALDDAVDEKNLGQVIDEWRRHSDIAITRFQFEKYIGAFHDMIDPQQPYQKTGVVYPRLVELIENLQHSLVV